MFLSVSIIALLLTANLATPLSVGMKSGQLNPDEHSQGKPDENTFIKQDNFNNHITNNEDYQKNQLDKYSQLDLQESQQNLQIKDLRKATNNDVENIEQPSELHVASRTRREAEISTTIVDGEPTSRCDWPWLVALTYNYQGDTGFLCAGSLVGNQWVITAAHCVYSTIGVEGLEIVAKLGSYNLTAKDEIISVPVVNITLNPGYDQEKQGYNDLALLQLKTAIKEKIPQCISPITADSPGEVGERGQGGLLLDRFIETKKRSCLIAGWGLTDPELEVISEVITQKHVEIMGNVACQIQWSKSMFIKPRILPQNVCVPDSTACYGDSGGPLQCYEESIQQWVLVGVGSFGPGNCKKFPVVYMRVSSFNDWIQETIGVS